jgi:hypothetical protein
MRRARWLSAKWPISMRTLASRMKSQLFVPESFDGFVIKRVRDDYIEAHYIEKFSYQETITDPFGQNSTFERISYRQIDFTLFTEFPNIELRDAHRSTREFLSKLLELCDFSVTVEPLSIDLLQWVERFESVFESHVLVDSLQISGIELESGIHAKMLLKGDEDVRPALGRLTKKQKFELEKLQMKIHFSNKSVPVQITSSAIAKIPEDFWDDVLPALRKSLAAQRQTPG